MRYDGKETIFSSDFIARRSQLELLKLFLAKKKKKEGRMHRDLGEKRKKVR